MPGFRVNVKWSSPQLPACNIITYAKTYNLTDFAFLRYDVSVLLFFRLPTISALSVAISLLRQSVVISPFFLHAIRVERLHNFRDHHQFIKSGSKCHVSRDCKKAMLYCSTTADVFFFCRLLCCAGRSSVK